MLHPPAQYWPPVVKAGLEAKEPVTPSLLAGDDGGAQSRPRNSPSADSSTGLLPTQRELAVFCDFDGTFVSADVGSSLARKDLFEKRSSLQRRYEAGELDAWSYIVELFDGFDFSAAALEDHLLGIELDPGARKLLRWCRARGVPFRILSDGFDYNLDRLQAIHRISFEYASNALRFEGDVWRISPGARNADCGCGTGLCKRMFIEHHRRLHLRALCVHIGDGEVSDLCAAEAADLVFAKGSLARALARRGIPFEAFESLLDVVERLEGLLGGEGEN